VETTRGAPPSLAARALVALVRGYQLIVSPWMAPRCKYYPSCSAYAVTAVRVHGAVRGTRLAVWRVLRCNPWSLGGVDHVPPPGARLGHDHTDVRSGSTGDPTATGDHSAASTD
jgi:putative membrane protein insertion efficiency factor